MRTVALVGRGRWGTNHLKVLQRLRSEGALNRLVVCDVDPDKLLDLEVDATYLSLADVLSNERLDAVAIVTPPDTHIELLETAIEHGLPVLVEKPLSNDDNAMRHVLAQLPDHAQMMVGYILRHHEGLKELRRRTLAGGFGDVQSVAYYRTTQREKPMHAEPINTLAVHGLDVVAWLFSEPLMSMETQHVSTTPVSATVDFQTTQSQEAKVHVAWASAEEVRTVTVAGTTARASFDFGTGVLEVQHSNGSNECATFESDPLHKEWEAFLHRSKAGSPFVYPSADALVDQATWIARYG